MEPTSAGAASPPPGPSFVSIAEIADQLGMTRSKVKQLLRDGLLVGVRRERAVEIPAEFVQAGEIVKGLGGTITLLADAGLTDAEIIRWLFDCDDDGENAMDQLRAGRGRRVHRQAQISGL